MLQNDVQHGANWWAAYDAANQDTGYLQDGTMFHWPDVHVAPSHHYTVRPVRGFRHVCAVFHATACIGWCFSTERAT